MSSLCPLLLSVVLASPSPQVAPPTPAARPAGKPAAAPQSSSDAEKIARVQRNLESDEKELARIKKGVAGVVDAINGAKHGSYVEAPIP